MRSADPHREAPSVGPRYLRAPAPLHFPTEETVPETILHLELRTALYMVMKLAFGERATIGSDQFVYWDPTDPGQCLAPDVFARLGPANAPFDSWKVWERGAPHVAVEIVSDSDASEGVWEGKLARYRKCGVKEVVRFDARMPGGSLRVWDSVEGDLVERDLEGVRSAESALLDAWWCVVHDMTLGPMVRLARDPTGRDILPTPVEAEARARKLAEARVLELEEELRRRGG